MSGLREEPTAAVLGGAVTVQLGELIITMMTPEHARKLAHKLMGCAQAIAPMFAVDAISTPLPRIEAQDTGPSPMYGGSD